MRRPTLRSIALLITVPVFVAGLVVAGRLAKEDLRGRQRYWLPFHDIECTPPAGLERPDFLDEVRYLADLPARLHLLEPGLAEWLAEGFARHPWVAKVERVEVLPPDRVHVQLQYRRPALAVPVGGSMRVVDERGVLLPHGASDAGLPVFEGKAAPPAGPAGTSWGDPAVEAAARQSPAGRKPDARPGSGG